MIRSTLHAVFVRRYDRWEWLLPFVLLALALATNGPRSLIALLGIILGRQSIRAARAWEIN